MIERVNKAIALGEGAVGKFALVEYAHKAMSTSQVLELLFDNVDIRACGDAQRGGIELLSLYAGSRKYAFGFFIQLVNFSLDHAADRFRQIAFDLWNRTRQNPIPIFFGQDPAIPKVPEQIGHEEGVALRSRVHKRCEIRWKFVPGKLKSKIAVDVFFAEKLKSNLAA